VVQWHIVFTAGAEDRGFESRHGVRYFRAWCIAMLFFATQFGLSLYAFEWNVKNKEKLLFVANLFRINCPIVRNNKSDRRGILFYARSGTPLQEWCRLHWHPVVVVIVWVKCKKNGEKKTFQPFSFGSPGSSSSSLDLGTSWCRLATHLLFVDDRSQKFKKKQFSPTKSTPRDVKVFIGERGR
jgi:hypothetical protein